jgi:hypothetical protein
MNLPALEVQEVQIVRHRGLTRVAYCDRKLENQEKDDGISV